MEFGKRHPYVTLFFKIDHDLLKIFEMPASFNISTKNNLLDMSLSWVTNNTHYTNNALTRGCHGRMTNPKGDCPPEAKPRVDTSRVGHSAMSPEGLGIICFVIPT